MQILFECLYATASTPPAAEVWVTKPIIFEDLYTKRAFLAHSSMQQVGYIILLKEF